MKLIVPLSFLALAIAAIILSCLYVTNKKARRIITAVSAVVGLLSSIVTIIVAFNDNFKDAESNGNTSFDSSETVPTNTTHNSTLPSSNEKSYYDFEVKPETVEIVVQVNCDCGNDQNECLGDLNLYSQDNREHILETKRVYPNNQTVSFMADSYNVTSNKYYIEFEPSYTEESDYNNQDFNLVIEDVTEECDSECYEDYNENESNNNGYEAAYIETDIEINGVLDCDDIDCFTFDTYDFSEMNITLEADFDEYEYNEYSMFLYEDIELCNSVYSFSITNGINEFECSNLSNNHKYYIVITSSDSSNANLSYNFSYSVINNETDDNIDFSRFESIEIGSQVSSSLNNGEKNNYNLYIDNDKELYFNYSFYDTESILDCNITIYKIIDNEIYEETKVLIENEYDYGITESFTLSEGQYLIEVTNNGGFVNYCFTVCDIT
ncbi:MAG: hypothetical protein ACLUFN_02775 [Eubacterium sp.]